MSSADVVYIEVGCELERKRVECAIMIKAALADEERMEGHEEA